jgi:hypothetical protein
MPLWLLVLSTVGVWAACAALTGALLAWQSWRRRTAALRDVSPQVHAHSPPPNERSRGDG